jgi:drug/metabolite transporter (DMT)-like permease
LKEGLAPYALLVVSVTLTVSGELLLKHGMNLHGEFVPQIGTLLPNLFRIFTNPYILGGFGLIFSASILWLSVISRVPLSTAYPMLSLGYLLTVLLSAIVLRETVPITRIAGVLLIVSGVVLVARS